LTFYQQFFVGLLEGDGSITVDMPNYSKRNLVARLRFFISLKNLPDNYKMLLLIKNAIGGNVIIERKDQYVTWSANSRNDITKILNILEKYPLLTSRKQCQLDFALKYITNYNSVRDTNLSDFLSDRKNKYANVEKYVFENSKKKIPHYFKAWLSGFIEAEAHFRLQYKKTGGVHSWGLSIGQNYDYYLLQHIKDYFESNHKITLDKNNIHYRITMYGPKCRQRIIEHLNQYPLLGDKQNSFIKWLEPYQSTK